MTNFVPPHMSEPAADPTQLKRPSAGMWMLAGMAMLCFTYWTQGRSDDPAPALVCLAFMLTGVFQVGRWSFQRGMQILRDRPV